MVFGPEKYVTFNLTRWERSRLAQLRGGVAPLRVETGRFRRLELENRTCELCQSGEVEDENHFLLSCDFFELERKNFIRGFTPLNWNEPKGALRSLFENNTRQIAKHISRCLELRQTKLYT